WLMTDRSGWKGPLTLLDIAVRDFGDDFDAGEPPDDDTLRQEVEVYIRTHDARERPGGFLRGRPASAPEMAYTDLRATSPLKHTGAANPRIRPAPVHVCFHTKFPANVM